MRRVGHLGATSALIALVLATPAAAAVEPGAYENVGSQYRNILPPGSNGSANAVELADFLATGGRPRNNSDQLPLYSDLIKAAPGLREKQIDTYYKDESFGVRPDDVVREYSPRDDVVIQRDRFGVPHIYGETRAGALFGTGYATAEDRLFFIDVLRHVGRAQLSSFAGGSPGNRAMDRSQWLATPYTEAELQRQFDLADDVYGGVGAQLQADARSYRDGINAYVNEAKLNPLEMPAEYAAIAQPGGPDPFKVTDLLATGALVAGIFGRGGGSELGSAMVLQEAKNQFGPRAGRDVWLDFRSAEDPEAPTTIQPGNGSFEYQSRANTDPDSRALPDRKTLRPHQVVVDSSGSAASADVPQTDDAVAPGLDLGAELQGLLSGGFPSSSSNALLVSGKESESGGPIAVFGPQVAYFAPEILIEQDVHAPAGPTGPAISARGTAFPGTNLYVQLGRGEDYAWSATSASQDIVDTYALPLCEPDGGKPTLDAMYYRFRGDCRAIEVLERRNSWTPTAADMTPPGSETLRAERTRLGIVRARAKVDGKPVAYTQLRTTYNHEADSAIGFAKFNDPDAINNARDYQRAANQIDLTFNWFYIDDKDIAYFNSGDNPVRPKGTDPDLPVKGSRRWQWEGYNPSLDLDKRFAPFSEKQASFEEHPQIVNQSFLTSWNNKQAPGFRCADSSFKCGSVSRVQPLDDRIERGIRGDRKMSLRSLVDAMADAATVDLRADKVLPAVLRVLGDQPGERGEAVALLRNWAHDGAHRRDEDRDGRYEHRRAVMLLDAWWPLWMRAEFQPELGEALFGQIQSMIGLDNAPNNHGDHLGSAYDDGWYGYASKDLRTVLGQNIEGPYSRPYCGGGDLGKCRSQLERSLDQAIKVVRDPSAMYQDSSCEDVGQNGTVECFDSIFFRPIGGVTQPNIPWQNRPTFQQAIEIKK